MIINKLNIIVDKYNITCKKIKLITNQENDTIIKQFMKRNNITKFSTEVDDFDDSCIIVMWNKNITEYNDDKIKFINEYIKLKKTFILLVPVKFNFNNLVMKCKSSSLDAISWRDDQGIKYAEYCIVIKND